MQEAHFLYACNHFSFFAKGPKLFVSLLVQIVSLCGSPGADSHSRIRGLREYSYVSRGTEYRIRVSRGTVVSDSGRQAGNNPGVYVCSNSLQPCV